MGLEEHAILKIKGPIIVLGASGFIGANLFLKILKYRKDVYAIVRSNDNWRLKNTPRPNLIKSNFLDSSENQMLIKKIKPKTIFNCIAYGAYSFEENNSLIYETNFSALINFVEALSKIKIHAFINAGTSSEYGTNSFAPLEDSICSPNSHYAVSKLNAASYLSFMGKFKKFPCIHLRLYSVYGPLEDCSRLIPNLVREGIQNSYPPFVNGNISRDFIFIDDACDAFIMAAIKINKNLYGEIFNIGSGVKTSIKQLANFAQNEFKIKTKPKIGTMDNRAWDLSQWVSNPTKANKIINWNSKVTIQNGLHLTDPWIRSLTFKEFTSFSKKRS